MTDITPRLEQVRQAIVALGGADAVTLQDLLSRLAGVEDNTLLSTTTLADLYGQLSVLVDIPFGTVNEEGYTQWPKWWHAYAEARKFDLGQIVTNTEAENLNSATMVGQLEGVPTIALLVANNLDAPVSTLETEAGATARAAGITAAITATNVKLDILAVLMQANNDLLALVPPLLAQLVSCCCNGGQPTARTFPGCFTPPQEGYVTVTGWEDCGLVFHDNTEGRLWAGKLSGNATNIALSTAYGPADMAVAKIVGDGLIDISIQPAPDMTDVYDVFHVFGILPGAFPAEDPPNLWQPWQQDWVQGMPETCTIETSFQAAAGDPWQNGSRPVGIFCLKSLTSTAPPPVGAIFLAARGVAS